jgi:hypothetical protein
MFNDEARAGMSRPKTREDFSATATHPGGGAGSGASPGLADIPVFHCRSRSQQRF